MRKFQSEAFEVDFPNSWSNAIMRAESASVWHSGDPTTLKMTSIISALPRPFVW